MTARTQFRLFVLACLAMLLLLPVAGARADLLDGLTSHWSFDDNLANVAENARHGVPIGTGVVITNTATEYQFGGGALSLNGTGGYVDVIGQVFPDNPDVFTVSAWANMQGTGSGGTTRVVWSTSPNYASELSMRSGTTTTGRPHWFSDGVENYNDPMTAANGEWHHYAVTWNRTSGHYKYYIDGALEHESTTDNGGDTFKTTTGFHVGADRNAGRRFNGFIDDVAVWNRVLSDAEIAAVYDDPIPVVAFPSAPVDPTGMLAEYTFEKKAGVPVSDGLSATGQVDDSASHAAGPLHAQGSFVPEIPNPVLQYSSTVPSGIGSSSSLSFGTPENAANYVNVPIPEDSALDNIATGDFRIEAWFKTTDTNRANIFASYFGGVDSAFNLELHTDNRVRIYLQDGLGSTEQVLGVASGITYADDEWHQLIATRSGTALTLTLDGVSAGTSASVLSFEQTQAQFRIGQDNRTSGTPKFTGLLDNVRIYNSADTSSLVAAYDFDTAGSIPTTDGQSAVGPVDDTTGQFDGTGFSGPAGVLAPAAAPQYLADAPGVLASSTHSLEIDASGQAEFAAIAMTPELAAITQGDFAVETWFRTTDAGRGVLVASLVPGEDAVNLELHEGNDVRIYLDGPVITDLRANAPAGIDTRDGEWHHLLGQREGDQVTVWLDGLLAGSREDLSGAYTMTGDTMYLGRDSRTDSTRFDGSLDNTRIWTRALSEAEIQSLAAGATPIPEPAGLTLLALGSLLLALRGARRRR